MNAHTTHTIHLPKFLNILYPMHVEKKYTSLILVDRE